MQELIDAKDDLARRSLFHGQQCQSAALIFFLGMAVLLPGCVSPDGHPPNREARITYYDRNGDGQVDMEKHKHPGVADADWVLLDDNYDSCYEKKILHGIAVKESSVHLVVPTGVHLESRH